MVLKDVVKPQDSNQKQCHYEVLEDRRVNLVELTIKLESSINM